MKKCCGIYKKVISLLFALALGGIGVAVSAMELVEISESQEKPVVEMVLTKDIAEDSNKYIEFLEKITNSEAPVKVTPFKEITNEQFAWLTSQDNIHELDLSGCVNLRGNFKYPKSLRKLDFSSSTSKKVNLGSLLCSLSHLKELDLTNSGCSLCEDGGLPKSLEKLSIDFSSKAMCKKSLRKRILGGGNLQDLKITFPEEEDTRNIDSEGLLTDMSFLPRSIKKLAIHNGKVIEGLKGLPEGLVELDLSGSYFHYSRVHRGYDIYSRCYNCDYRSCMKETSCYELSEDLIPFSEFKSLPATVKKLTLNKWNHLTADAIQYLPENIERLSLDNCDSIDGWA